MATDPQPGCPIESAHKLLARASLFSQHHQAVSAKHANRQVRRQGKTELPWNPCNFLDQQVSQLNTTRSIERINDGVSNIGQGAQGGFLGEIVKMRVMIAAKKETVLTQNCLNREI